MVLITLYLWCRGPSICGRCICGGHECFKNSMLGLSRKKIVLARILISLVHLPARNPIAFALSKGDCGTAPACAVLKQSSSFFLCIKSRDCEQAEIVRKGYQYSSLARTNPERRLVQMSGYSKITRRGRLNFTLNERKEVMIYSWDRSSEPMGLCSKPVIRAFVL